MHYKPKEVSQILNIPTDTLRYFEKIGVINPKVNEQNHYRYYDAWDINFLFDYLNCRKMDFNSQESINFIKNSSLEQQINFINEKIKDYQKKEEYYHLLSLKSKNTLSKIENIHAKLNKVEICYNEPFYYTVYRHNYNFSKNDEIKKVKNQWLKNHALLNNIVFVPKNIIEERRENEYYWSLAFNEKYFKYLKLEENQYVHYRPSTLCIKIMIDAKSKGQFHYNLLEKAFNFIEEHNFEIADDPFGRLLIRNNDDTGFHRYIEFYIPIKL